MDTYVVLHVKTNDPYSRDTPETTELAWCTVDVESLEISPVSLVLINPNILSIPGTNEELKSPSFKTAIEKFDLFIYSNLLSQNKDFTFVTLDISKLRVQLSREARDKYVVLPSYLQHPRVFDLKNEYSKWQFTHPEALSYTASSLSNIVTALQVEIDQEDSGVIQDYSASAASTVKLCSKVLTQLIKRSLPIQDHPTVFTKPYDSSQDAKIFLTERSKILYLANLPHDTTQSELESWFTQHGGRPVAFWTLKNLESGDSGPKSKRSISGFAVFAKHEEAAESLSMNGRVLNDHIVEVQASSTRVLDKANDLLTPFPPSKNRPRPGDWTCPSCGFSNFQRRTACFRCSFPASSAVAMQDQVYGSGNSTGTRRHSKTNSNSIDKIALNTAVVNAAAAVLNTNGQYPDNYSHNNRYNSVPFRAGDWKCTNENCQYHNFAKNLCCLKCGNAKPASTGNMNHNGNNQYHSVNSTAAAIAAATASGQPLNLNNSWVPPQMYRQNQVQPSQQSQPQMNMLPQHLAFLQHQQHQQQQPQQQHDQKYQKSQGQGQVQNQNQKYNMYQNGYKNSGDLNVLSNQINQLSLNQN